MSTPQNQLRTLAGWLRKIPVVLIVIVTFILGYQFSAAVHRGPAPQPSPTGSAARVWTCSMHPQIRLPEPGQCPICGMDLVPAQAASGPSSQPGGAERNLYACSMFCLPPQPNPGKCAICGMDMVVVAQGVEDDSPARRLSLSAAARALAEVQTAKVSRQFVTAEIRMVGKVTYDETRLGYITAWVPGRLERLYVDYTGIPVQRGDHLVYLYSPELASAQTELLQALERVRDGGGQGSLVNQRAREWLEDIRDKFRLWGLTDEQIQDIEQRGTSSDYMTIYAPMGGIVIDKNAVEGMYVNTGTRIYTIADLSRVWIKLAAYESDLKWLRYGQTIEFQTEAYPGEVFEGRISFIDPVLDARTRTVNLRVNVDNADGHLKPEMFVRAVVQSKVAQGGRVVDAELAGKWISPMHPEIVKDHPGTCDVCGMPLVRAESLGFVSVETLDAKAPLVIPATAPLITGKRALVYVRVPGTTGEFEGREVLLGPRAGDYYLVSEGLQEGEEVVVHGNFKIDSAMQIVARPSMMNPSEAGRVPADPHDTDAAPAESLVLAAPRPEITSGVTAMQVTPGFDRQLEPLFTAYLEMQNALSRDHRTEAVTGARRMGALLPTIDDPGLGAAVAEAWRKERAQLKAVVDQVVSAPDVPGARLGFALLSEGMIAVAKRFGAGGAVLHRFHCPMAFDGRGADWLQTSERAENPFFGSTMFRCGTLKETIGVMEDPKRDDG